MLGKLNVPGKYWVEFFPICEFPVLEWAINMMFSTLQCDSYLTGFLEPASKRLAVKLVIKYFKTNKDLFYGQSLKSLVLSSLKG